MVLIPKTISSALKGFLNFKNPSLNTRDAMILVTPSLFKAVHELPKQFVVLLDRVVHIPCEFAHNRS